MSRAIPSAKRRAFIEYEKLTESGVSPDTLKVAVDEYIAVVKEFPDLWMPMDMFFSSGFFRIFCLPVNGEHVVYRAFTKDRVLVYVGYSGNYASRRKQHSKTSDWWKLSRVLEIEVYPTRNEALRAELKAIQTENPLWNVQGKTHS